MHEYILTCRRPIASLDGPKIGRLYFVWRAVTYPASGAADPSPNAHLDPRDPLSAASRFGGG